jgi:hypothetical protein
VDTPAAVLGLVLVMTAVGTSLPLWTWPTWGHVRHGFELLTGATVALLALAGRAVLDVPLASAVASDPAGPGGMTRPLLLVMVVATVAAMAVLALPLPAVLGRLLGLAATAAGIAALAPMAQLRAVRGGAGGLGQGLAELALGATLLGGVWFGMILGHWYLVERRLTNAPMVRIAWVNVVAVGAGLASVLLSWRNPAPCADLEAAAFQQCATLFAPVLRIGAMTIVLGIGVLSLVALIAAFNVRLAKEGGRSIQAATGMFYLAVVLAPAVEFAAKVRFF